MCQQRKRQYLLVQHKNYEWGLFLFQIGTSVNTQQRALSVTARVHTGSWKRQLEAAE